MCETIARLKEIKSLCQPTATTKRNKATIHTFLHMYIGMYKI